MPYRITVVLLLVAFLLGCDPQPDESNFSEQQPESSNVSSVSTKRNIAFAENRATLELERPGSVAVLPTLEGSLIASLSHSDNYLQLWSVSQKREVKALATEGAGFHPDMVRWVDWDHDGVINELLVSAEGAKEIEVWQYQNSTLQKLGSFKTEDAPVAITVADFDQDGRLDIVASPYEGTRLTLFWRIDGLTTVQPQFLAAGKEPTYPKAIDWDNDGLLDIVWSDWQSDSLRWAKNKGQREFVVEILDKATGSRPRETAVGDINGDGFSDLLTVLELGESATIYYGNGKGGIANTESIPSKSNGYIAAAIAIDSKNEITTLALAEWDAIVIAQRNQNKEWSYWRRATSGSLPQDLQFVDIDKDSNVDLLFANSAGNHIEIQFGPVTNNMEVINFSAE